MHTREKDFFFLNALKISLAPTPREGPFHVMFVRTQTYSENQDATKITSGHADSRIYSSWTMVSFLVKTLCLCLILHTFQLIPYASANCPGIVFSAAGILIRLTFVVLPGIN